MIVTVRLHATLRRPTPTGYQNRVRAELENGATVASLLEMLNLNIDPEHLMVLLDRRRVGPNHPLADGDHLDLFPPISGGANPMA